MPVYSTRVNRRGRPVRGRPRRKTGLRRSMVMTKTPRYNSYFFKRKLLKGTIQLSNLAETFGSYVFKLSDLPNYTEFTNLFDRYRILKVGVIFIPNWTSNDSNPITTINTINPSIYTAIDYTEDGTPLALTELYEDSHCKITRGSKIHKRYFSPAVLASSFETVTTTAYTPKWKQWITTDDPATPHYALKWAMDKIATGSGQNFYVKVFMTYYIQCKDLK